MGKTDKESSMYRSTTTASALRRDGQTGFKRRIYRPLFAAVAALGMLTFAVPAFAHCDSMDGPVVEDAQRAIAARDVTPVLKWVTQADEDQIRSAFEMTLAVRVRARLRGRWRIATSTKP